MKRLLDTAHAAVAAIPPFLRWRKEEELCARSQKLFLPRLGGRTKEARDVE
jgi:hypothetical protein